MNLVFWLVFRHLGDFYDDAKHHFALAPNEPLTCVLENGLVRLREGNFEEHARAAGSRRRGVRPTVNETKGRVWHFVKSLDVLATTGNDRLVGVAKERNTLARSVRNRTAFRQCRWVDRRHFFLEVAQERDERVVDRARHAGDRQGAGFAVPSVSRPVSHGIQRDEG